MFTSPHAAMHGAIAPPPLRSKIILAVAASDAHVVANHLIAILLRDAGFEVINLGAATPILEIMETYQEHRDAIAIIIGSLNGHAVEDLRGLAASRRDWQVRCPVIVGGNLSVGARKTGDAERSLLADGVDVVVERPEDRLPVLADLALDAMDATPWTEHDHAARY